MLRERCEEQTASNLIRDFKPLERNVQPQKGDNESMDVLKTFGHPLAVERRWHAPDDHRLGGGGRQSRGDGHHHVRSARRRVDRP